MSADLNSLPLYVQIADRLRHDIEAGVHGVGDRLAPELQLSERFQVNRHTIRRAIGLLKDEGILRVDRGRGTYVAASPIRYPIGKRVRYNQALKAQGLKPVSQLLSANDIPAESTVAKHLTLNPGELVVAIERLSTANDRPISVASSYFPHARFANIDQHLRSTPSISKVLLDVYHCDHLRLKTTVSARTVRPQDARLLNVSLNHPILLVESINVDRENQPVEYGVTRLRGDSMELEFTNDLSDN